jgi:hypothetical protein
MAPWARLFGRSSGKTVQGNGDVVVGDAMGRGGLGLSGSKQGTPDTLGSIAPEGPLPPPIATRKTSSGATLKLIERTIHTSGIDLGVAAHDLHSSSGAILDCYQAAASAQPGLGGDVWSKLTLDPDGGVSAIRISAVKLKAPKLETCIRQVLAKQSFGKLKGATATVEYPIVLDSSR